MRATTNENQDKFLQSPLSKRHFQLKSREENILEVQNVLRCARRKTEQEMQKLINQIKPQKTKKTKKILHFHKQLAKSTMKNYL